MGEVKVNIEKLDGNEVVVRTGQALPPLPKEALKTDGTIGVPFAYIEKRKKTIVPENAVVVVDVEKRTIEFIQDQYDSLSPVIKGSITLDPDLLKWEIGTSKTRSSKDLAMMIKSNRLMFESTELATQLVTIFSDLKVKVEKEINDRDDKRGNVNKTYAQVVREMSIPEGFNLVCPVIKGGEKKTVPVEIVINPDTFEIALISPTINEILKNETGNMIDAEIKMIKDVQPDIPILYV